MVPVMNNTNHQIGGMSPWRYSTTGSVSGTSVGWFACTPHPGGTFIGLIWCDGNGACDAVGSGNGIPRGKGSGGGPKGLGFGACGATWFSVLGKRDFLLFLWGLGVCGALCFSVVGVGSVAVNQAPSLEDHIVVPWLPVLPGRLEFAHIPEPLPQRTCLGVCQGIG